MMRRLVLTAAVVLLAIAPAHAVQVGWSVDVRQNQYYCHADDYHVWGVLESIGQAPRLTGHDQVTYACDPACGCGGTPCSDCGNFQNFSYRIGGQPNDVYKPRPAGYPLNNPWPPVAPFYYFEANWWGPKHVGYNDWAHFGLKFDEGDANYGYWLQGEWTGSNIPNPGGPLLATPAIVGFEFSDGPGGRLRVGTGDDGGIIWPPQPPPPPPPPDVWPQGALRIDKLELAAMPVGTDFPVENLTNSFFDVYPDPIFWANVPIGSAYMAPDSFFDIFLESVAVPGTGGQSFAQLAPGQLILARQQVTYQIPNPQNALQPLTQTYWQYEMHEVVPEPSTIGLLLAGLGAAAVLVWRKRK